jgi:hypothetical protein
MKLKFQGSFEDLKNKLTSLGNEWKVINENQIQFHASDGGILNWYPSKGTLLFQGPSENRDLLENKVREILEKENLSQKLSSNLDKKDSVTDVNEIDEDFSSSELFIGLVGAVGTELKIVQEILTERLSSLNYQTENIKVSSDIIKILSSVDEDNNYFKRTGSYMDAGNKLRKDSRRNDILSLGIAGNISQMRTEQTMHRDRTAYIINSLKHPEEVRKLRQIYSSGFYLIGVHSEKERRKRYLVENKKLSEIEADQLIAIDENEYLNY